MSFKNILNFRNIVNNLNLNEVRPNIIFRSANLDNANEQEVKELLNKYNIHTIIDLRSSKESKTTQNIGLYFPVQVFSEESAELLNPLDSNKKDDSSSNKETIQSAEKQFDDNNQTKYLRKTYRVDLVSKKYKKKVIWDRINICDIIYLVFYYISFNRIKGNAYIANKYISSKGLSGLYLDILKYSGNEIAKVFKRIENSSNQPFLIHCAHGKDRTGIIIALLLDLLKVDRQLIIQDYLNSSDHLQSAMKQIEYEMKLSGLSNEFALVTKEAIQAVFQYIDMEYSGIENYLATHGFDNELQVRLSLKLLI